MKSFGRIAAALGFLAALWLVRRDNPQEVLNLLRVAGAGIVLAALFHALPMMVNARLWQSLVGGTNRPGLGRMMQWVWIRESVNGLLPVARVGGEIISFRLMRRAGLAPDAAAGSIVVDMQLTMLAQLLFTTAGVIFLIAHAASPTLRLAGDLAWGAAGLTPPFVLFALVQYARPFERASRAVNRFAGGRLIALVGESTRIDRRIKLIWSRRAVVLRCLFFWQPLQLFATSLELWVALRFMHIRFGLAEAFVFEVLIEAVASAAFFVPGGLGVQEGGFVLIGGILGLDPATCLALAGARRVRDLIVYVPGLLGWQLAESGPLTAAALQSPQTPRAGP